MPRVPEHPMLKTVSLSIAGLLVVAVTALLVVAATRPDSFRVERTLSVKATPEKLFAIVSDLPGWRVWSPYEAKDPAMRRTYGGPASGVGAVYTWEGNNDVGQGRMEIVQATLSSRIVIALDFLKPFEAHNTAELLFEPKGDATDVTWAIHGPSPFVSKMMGVIFDMDKMIGGDFEVGLAKLKAMAER